MSSSYIRSLDLGLSRPAWTLLSTGVGVESPNAPHALWIGAALAALAGGGYALVLERFLPEGLRRTPRRLAPVAA